MYGYVFIEVYLKFHFFYEIHSLHVNGNKNEVSRRINKYISALCSKNVSLGYVHNSVTQTTQLQDT